ncbi:MAG: ATP-binding cassette domain-containing protein [Syntrophomonadaceae bacterium]|nr:ATP-binding cassette domain-containing protein [Syntrophomonadaceae bacterium]MDD3023633.1 ATP-binding cassette domain-containing protein [Syntrophomonadaceae bacterium]
MPIEIENLVYIYQKGTPFEKIAINNLSLKINDGEIIGIMGVTGSGKSTLLQLLNALLTPFAGNIAINGLLLSKMKKKQLAKLRQQVGMVFQYPEQQIFEECIFDEVAFGPLNMGLDEVEAEKRVVESLWQVGLDPQLYKERSTAKLSGGEKRRLAIAGILALNPRYLLLDEPTAGLDQEMQTLLLDNLRELHQIRGMTIVMVSHHLTHILDLCERIIIMDNGSVCADTSSDQLLNSALQLDKLGIDLTPSLEVVHQLNQKGWGIALSPRNPEQAGRLITEKLANKSFEL